MESVTGRKNSLGSSNMLAPGFRFHPTDEELVRYYLRRKVCGKGFRVDAISDVDIYKAEPWDLPNLSKLKTRDREWYFFSMLDKKYGNGARTNRATEKGYWKTTGKDRAVYHKNQIVGMKKTLVYHIGRAPKGQRSNWVMHEYRLTDLELERAGIHQEAFVLCRVFQKSGSGPKNGEQYGAPFEEEEWLDDELEFVPKAEAVEEVDFGDDAYLDGHDLEQILGSDVPSDVSPLQSAARPEDGSSGEETAESANDSTNLLPSEGDKYFETTQNDENNLYGLLSPYDMNVRAVKHEYIGESSKSGYTNELDFLLDEPVVEDSSNGVPYGNGGFIEANELPNPVEMNTSSFDMFDEYLMNFDAIDDNPQHIAYDPSAMLGSEDLISDQPLLPLPEELDGETELSSLLIGQPLDNHGAEAASPSDMLDSSEYELGTKDFQYPFLKEASQMLGAIPAEFPSRAAALRLNSLSQPSSSVHVTAGMIQIRNLTNEGCQSLGKPVNLNIVVSFGYSQSNGGSTILESSVSLLGRKAVVTLSWGWFFFMLLWVLVLSISYKIGAYVCAKYALTSATFVFHSRRNFRTTLLASIMVPAANFFPSRVRV